MERVGVMEGLPMDVDLMVIVHKLHGLLMEPEQVLLVHV
jgi:hypothetical protein